MSTTDGGPSTADIDSAVATLEAFLHRPAQDPLEAAVVLEAWGGYSPDVSLQLSGIVAAHPRPRIGRNVVPVNERAVAGTDWSTAIGDLGFVIGVLMTGLWVSDLAANTGERGVDLAWRVALPFSLGAQWFVRRRYLGGPDGMGRLRREFGRSAATLLVVTAAMTAIPRWGWVAAALTLLWLGGFLVARHGWGLPFGVALLAGTLSRYLDVPSTVLLAGSAVAAVVIGGVALLNTPASNRRPAPVGRALPAASIGAGLGLLLVLEPRFPWAARGVLPTLTVIPSLLGSLWAGVHMSKLWEILPPSLAASPLHLDSREPGRLLGTLWRGATYRLLTGTLAGSAVVIGYSYVAPSWAFVDARLAVQGRRIVFALLAAHGVLAIAGLVVALLEALGRWGVGLTATLAGCAVALTIDLSGLHPEPGLRILGAATVALVIGMPSLLTLLRDPARTLGSGI
jgi:hypothetical protein